jgi:Flp pilus assembly protein CpaB
MPRAPFRPRPPGRLIARRPRSGLRRRIRRSAALYWLAAALLAVGGARILLDTARDAEAARRSWGETRLVMVATRPLPAGRVIATGDVTPRQWPAALVPPGALTEMPVGRTVTTPVMEGEALNALRVAPDGVGGAGALLGGNRRAVAVPTGPGRLALAVGDRIDLVAIGADGRPAVVGVDGEVLAVAEDTVTVAVGAGDGPAVAAAVAAGEVTPLLRPP